MALAFVALPFANTALLVAAALTDNVLTHGSRSRKSALARLNYHDCCKDAGI